VTRLGTVILARPAVSIAVIVSATMLVGLIAMYAVKDWFGTDFSVYWRAANETLAEVYLPRDELPFPYPPTMLLWISPLAVMPMWVGFALWVSLSAALLALACRPYLSVPATALVLFSPPVVNTLVTGQVSVALAAGLLWACGAANRIAAGITFAVIASIKPQFVIMAPLLFLVKNDWKALLSSVAIFCLIVAVSLLVFGKNTWFVWLASLDNFHSVLLNQDVLWVAATPAAVAEHWALPPFPFWLIGTCVGIWLVVRCSNLPPVGQSAALACGSLLAAPYALVYDLAAVAPFLVWSAFQGRVTSALALSGALHPIPLVLTAFGLAKENLTILRTATPSLRQE
jgi:hypothetical protein